MNCFIRCAGFGLLAAGWLAAEAVEPPRSAGAAPRGRNTAIGNDVDYAATLRDPFSPIGYRLPASEAQAQEPVAAAVSNVPAPAVDLKAKAKALLSVKGIMKRGKTYVANINGAIVQVGDEINVTVDGRTMVFIVRAISMQRVEIEPRR